MLFREYFLKRKLSCTCCSLHDIWSLLLQQYQVHVNTVDIDSWWNIFMNPPPPHFQKIPYIEKVIVKAIWAAIVMLNFYFYFFFAKMLFTSILLKWQKMCGFYFWLPLMYGMFVIVSVTITDRGFKFLLMPLVHLEASSIYSYLKDPMFP